MATDARLRYLVREIEGLFADAREGLPDDLFYLVSRLTPLVNVDLLIQNPERETLLTWRDDPFHTGWHIPGGIIRFKERAVDRIRAVACLELGATADPDPEPFEVHERQHRDRDVRGHFISLIYRTRLISGPEPLLACPDVSRPRHGQWAWHRSCPSLLISAHSVYRHLFDR